ncbi:LacI family DNA-binding transcriptional regulator [Rugosimonospora africana]|uniref:LacI family transcriptional regulator n=1 Tax=Rugosimonospora africana TaxID=556532 RepID=A0A8J3R275_9ACTN|nr:LacI family DNA-binding transcriptional regulator [Rugosimonospora africana]GIH20030.1 LacI family transcriptional regulator [Rugosimonospora africana]
MAGSTGGDGQAAPTIYDVARAAGVAASTVSRAFARPARVNAETAGRIRRIAEEMGYRTNPLARALLNERSSMIALAISDITNPYCFEIIRGAQAAAMEVGYTMLLADGQESDRLERETLDRAARTVEGIVLASTRMSDTSIRMMAKLRPLIVLNRAVAGVPSVVTDYRHGMREAVEHLHGLGHSHITYLAGPEAAWSDGIRWQALREAGVEWGLRLHRLGPYPPTMLGGVAAADDFWRRSTSAVIAYNDLVALGLLRGLSAAGVRVPQDVSVVGCDNIFGTDLVTPGLTTLAAPLRFLGRTAVQSLLALISGAQPPVDKPVSIPTRLVVRASTDERRPARLAPPAIPVRPPISTPAGTPAT